MFYYSVSLVRRIIPGEGSQPLEWLFFQRLPVGWQRETQRPWRLSLGGWSKEAEAMRSLWRTDELFQEQLKEMDEHVARLQGALRTERAKVSQVHDGRSVLLPALLWKLLLAIRPPTCSFSRSSRRRSWGAVNWPPGGWRRSCSSWPTHPERRLPVRPTIPPQHLHCTSNTPQTFDCFGSFMQPWRCWTSQLRAEEEKWAKSSGRLQSKRIFLLFNQGKKMTLVAQM